ncbi:transcriptional repressor LexA [Candidatus Uhrbacteria bacterium]|nr:transcriptional repressor LexA [Candidatus Uhrbacteria bacterium]
MDLTKKQKEVLDFLVDYIDDKGYAPCYREIGEKLGLSSSSTVHFHVQALAEKGYLKITDEARSIELTSKVRKTAPAIALPMLGLIAAGKPIEAIENREDMSVPVDLGASETAYVLKVKGDSMIEDGIFDGDMVVVEKEKQPRNGDVVVAILEGDSATLKRFYKEKDRVRLQPANSTMKPIFAKEVELRGVVKAVIRKY